MRYVRLTDVWPFGGEAVVVFSLLQDAGFAPATECDLRGWLYFRGGPRGSFWPVTIWVPDCELDDATAFLASSYGERDVHGVDDMGAGGFWSTINVGSPLLYVVMLVVVLTGMIAL